jgi:hypothetical protein
MARPSGLDWQPLSLTGDPVPGDPQSIYQDAARILSVARQLEGQSARLRKIAASEENIGKTADTIRATAGELAGELAVVARRYTTTGNALNGWAPDLEEAQRLSVRALDAAEIPWKKLTMASCQIPGPGGVTGLAGKPPDTPALRQALAELEDAQALLNRAVNYRDTQGEYWSAQVTNACNDALKDSWWEGFTDWISDHAGLIADVCTALEVVATGLAVLALIFTGVGWIVLLGLAVTALALTGRTMLALTGKGSWLDVGIDLLALIGFGAGNFATRFLGKTVESMTTLAKGVEAERFAPILERFTANATGVLGKAGVAQVVDRLADLQLPASHALVSFLDRLLGPGDGESINLLRTAAKLAAKYGDDARIQAYAAQAKVLGKFLEFNFRGVNAAVLTGLTAGHIPGIDDVWDRLENVSTTGAVNLSTGQADALADASLVAAPPLGITLEGFRWAWSEF